MIPYLNYLVGAAGLVALVCLRWLVLAIYRRGRVYSRTSTESYFGRGERAEEIRWRWVATTYGSWFLIYEKDGAGYESREAAELAAEEAAKDLELHVFALVAKSKLERWELSSKLALWWKS